MTVYIGIGSNLGDRQMYINRAIEMLGQRVKKVSSIYETEPVGMKQGRKFLNAVVEIETDMCPLDLLRFIERIEKMLGRKEKGKYKPRTIDLDILLYGKEIINTPKLKIPHPKLGERDFALNPLLELWKR